MSEVYINVRYGLGRTVFGRDFTPLTGKLLKRVHCLRGAFTNELVITNQNVLVPARALESALSRLRSSSPVICLANLPLETSPRTLGEAVTLMKKNLAQESERYGRRANKIGVSLEAESHLFEATPGTPLYLTFCPYFGLSFQVRSLLSTAAVLYRL